MKGPAAAAFSTIMVCPMILAVLDDLMFQLED